MLNALDKKSAQEKELNKEKAENHDHRNLYLAKVDFHHCLLLIQFRFWPFVLPSF